MIYSHIKCTDKSKNKIERKYSNKEFVTAKLLTMSEFRDAPAGLNFHGKGSMITPLGANLIKSTDIEGTLVALDKNYALEMVTAGGVMTDFDRLIDRQLERATISQISGFAKIFADSAKVMNV